MDFEPMDLSIIGEEEYVTMGVGNEQVFHKISFFCGHANFSPSAPVLRLVKAEGISLYITPVTDRYHHILFRNHILEINFRDFADNFRSAFIAEFFPNCREFLNNDVEDQVIVSQNFPQSGNVLYELLVFLQNLFSLQSGKPLEPHVQNGLSLLSG